MARAHFRRVAVAGAATGLRSSAALAALIVAEAPGLPGPLARPLARRLAWLALAAELTLDKLPSTPSRLEPRGLAGRIVGAGAAAAVLARGARQPILPSVLVGTAAALLGARVGHDLRARAAKRVPPFAAATAEDVVALGLAAASCVHPDLPHDRAKNGRVKA